MRIRHVIRIVMPQSVNILMNIKNALRKQLFSCGAGTRGETCLLTYFKKNHKLNGCNSVEGALKSRTFYI